MTTDRVEIYDDHGQEFRWRRVAANGQTVATPGEGYTTKYHAIRAALTRNVDVPPERFIDRTRGGVIVRSVLVARILGRAAAS